MQVELMVSRFHNLAPIPPLAWQRGLVGVLAGALPHALEGALGYVFDAADGGDYYARKRNELFKQRHPGELSMGQGVGLIRGYVVGCAEGLTLVADEQEEADKTVGAAGPPSPHGLTTLVPLRVHPLSPLAPTHRQRQPHLGLAHRPGH